MGHCNCKQPAAALAPAAPAPAPTPAPAAAKPVCALEEVPVTVRARTLGGELLVAEATLAWTVGELKKRLAVPCEEGCRKRLLLRGRPLQDHWVLGQRAGLEAGEQELALVVSPPPRPGEEELAVMREALEQDRLMGQLLLSSGPWYGHWYEATHLGERLCVRAGGAADARLRRLVRGAAAANTSLWLFLEGMPMDNLSAGDPRHWLAPERPGEYAMVQLCREEMCARVVGFLHVRRQQAKVTRRLPKAGAGARYAQAPPASGGQAWGCLKAGKDV